MSCPPHFDVYLSNWVVDFQKPWCDVLWLLGGRAGGWHVYRSIRIVERSTYIPGIILHYWFLLQVNV